LRQKPQRPSLAFHPGSVESKCFLGDMDIVIWVDE